MPSPDSSGSVSSYFASSGDSRIDPFLWGVKWGGALHSGATVTYSFPDKDSEWGSPYAEPNTKAFEYRGFRSTEQAAARSALKAWSDVANINFQEVNDTSANVGDIRFAFSSKVGREGAAAWAYLPASAYQAGDIWLDPNYPPNLNFRKGGFGYSTLLHEIGHALGLTHPFDGSAILPHSLDNFKYTVMSYTNHPYTNFEPTSPLLYDILAIQYIYGANMSTRVGNSTYSFGTSQEYLMAIWDAGGNGDTINCSRQTTGCKIDLQDGAFSSIGIKEQGGLARDNVAIAFGAIIENATGGSGNDRINGNDVGNRLRGLGGHDRLYGEIGDDHLIGGTGNDKLIGSTGDDILDGSTGRDRLSGGAGNDSYVLREKSDIVLESDTGGADDTVRSSFSVNLNVVGGGFVEHATLFGGSALNATGNGFDNTMRGNGANNTLSGLDGDDALVGNSGRDRLFGGSGSDIISGGNGNDRLDGGAAGDQLTGGAGVDTFDYNALADAGDTISDFTAGAGGDVIDLADLLDGLGYVGSDAFADGYVEFTQSGANTLVRIDANGGGDGFQLLTILTNVTLSSADISNYLL